MRWLSPFEVFFHENYDVTWTVGPLAVVFQALAKIPMSLIFVC